MSDTRVVNGSVAELSAAFDRSFALPPIDAPPGIEDFINIRVVGDPYAVRLAEITAVVARRTVIPVPASSRHFLGLAGIRGGIVPVFGLASMLGYAGDSDAPAWMVLVGVEEPIALAFSEFEGHLRLPASAIHASASRGAAQQHVREVASTDAGVRAIISIPLIVAAIRNRIGHDQRQPSVDQ